MFARSYELILGVFGNEDFRAAEITQQGLAAGVPQEAIYCGLETNIIHYYEAIEALSLCPIHRRTFLKGHF